ncbi:hypothetical protein TCAL_04004 [Tigriopus californicus]|uniref:Major facilitator superfamily associated domain-containing protein n=2 Tax=Tigriopus californicus TaxID=6832 RepID=A0A553NCF0_TIGCA|nr:major facilitator superfamily domain-containing protein 6-like isoform X1 [Tigriopus californicus]TRY63123.1 hypothetical protein TCAL_04004 [Tigriopus californicus]
MFEPGEDAQSVSIHVSVLSSLTMSEQEQKPTLSTWQWFVNDLTNVKLVWVKLIFFLQSAGLVVLFPYLSIHMKSMGFSLEDTAWVTSAMPIADILAPPLAGIIADKMGNFRVFMCIITFLNGASSLVLLLIPRLQDSSLVEDVALNITLGSTDISSSNADWTTSFWSYLASRGVLDVFRASSLTLFEGAMSSIIREHGGDYGLQKVFGTLGSILFGPLAGLVIDLGSKVVGTEDYSFAFYLYFGLRAAAAMVMLKLSLTFRRGERKVLTNAWAVLHNLDVISYLVAFFVLGVLWGYLENYLFWHLSDLGVKKIMMGVSLGAAALIGLPLSLFSKRLLQFFGHNWIVLMALIVYVIRLTTYSVTLNPHIIVALECLKPLSHSLIMISVFNFIMSVTPKEITPTMNSIFGAAYFGVGRGLGGLIGGFLMENYGTLPTFKSFAVMAGVATFLYSLVTFWIKIRNRVSYSEVPLRNTLPT